MIGTNEITKRIEELGEERGWSGFQIAENCSIPRSAYYHMKKRNAPPSLELLIQICKGFEITIGTFFKEEQETVTEAEKNLLLSFRKLRQKEKLLLIEYAGKLVANRDKNRKC